MSSERALCRSGRCGWCRHGAVVGFAHAVGQPGNPGTDWSGRYQWHRQCQGQCEQRKQRQRHTSPLRPGSTLLAPSPIIALAPTLLVPLIAAAPVRVRFSRFTASVCETDDRTVSTGQPPPRQRRRHWLPKSSMCRSRRLRRCCCRLFIEAPLWTSWFLAQSRIVAIDDPDSSEWSSIVKRPFALLVSGPAARRDAFAQGCCPVLLASMVPIGRAIFIRGDGASVGPTNTKVSATPKSDSSVSYLAPSLVCQ